jgi:hypothetical protein
MNYFKIACVPTEEVSGHLYVCWGCTNWGSERSSVCVLVMVSMLLVYQLRKWAVICMCVGVGVDDASVSMISRLDSETVLNVVVIFFLFHLMICIVFLFSSLNSVLLTILFNFTHFVYIFIHLFFCSLLIHHYHTYY